MRAWTFLVIYYMGIQILRKGCEAQATCAINPCIMFNICNDKECILNEDCTVKCVCGANSNLPECVNTGSPKTEVLSSSAYPITASCQCVHGICTDDRSCKCENGWSGNNCDKLCNLKCDKGQKCTIVSGIFAVCQPIATTTMPTTLETVLTSTLSQISENTSQNYNVCDVSYTQRPSNETMCNGWLCLFGVCRSEGSQVWCDCDPGGFGQNCHAKCCRQCVHGSCYFVMEENKEICNCQENYSGPYCERWDPPSRTQTNVSGQHPVLWSVSPRHIDSGLAVQRPRGGHLTQISESEAAFLSRRRTPKTVRPLNRRFREASGIHIYKQTLWNRIQAVNVHRRIPEMFSHDRQTRQYRIIRMHILNSVLLTNELEFIMDTIN